MLPRTPGSPESTSAALPSDQADRLGDALRRAGVPRRYIDRSLDSFEAIPGTERALAAARQCIAEPCGMALIGDPGTGKTHLVTGILRGRAAAWLAEYPTDFITTADGVVARPPFRSRFVVVPDLLDQLREHIGDAKGVPDPLPDLEKAPLVVLDDLGREKATDWVLDRLYVLVNRRYNDMLPTIVTSNYPLDELADRGYEAMLSRLLDSAHVVRLSAPDYRKPKAAARR